jgi:hypothetical protein
LGSSVVKSSFRKILAFGGCITCCFAAASSHAQQIQNHIYQTNVTVDVLPFALLAFDSVNPLLYLQIPPGSSTIPSSGVKFIVTGNADATLAAEPDAFVEVQTDDGLEHLGKAVLGPEAVGYKLELRFPRASAPLPGSPNTPRYAALPGFEEGPTTPPLTVDLATTGQQRTGEIHMEAHHNWTPSGGLPLPGLYVGQVTLTLTASN